MNRTRSIPMSAVLLALAGLIVPRPALAEERPPVEIGVEAGGGFAGLAQEDFVKAASDNAGLAEPAGWTGGARAIVQLGMGLGVSAGYSVEGGGRYDNTIVGFNKKKAATITRTILATYDQTVVPISLHYRTPMHRFSLGAEAGVDVTTGTVHYTERDSQGEYLEGDLAADGLGYHVAVEGAMQVTGGLSGYVRLGYAILSLDAFTGMVDDNGVLKPEMLFMVKESGTDREQLEVSTSNSLTSSDHRPARVAGGGIRLTAGLRWIF